MEQNGSHKTTRESGEERRGRARNHSKQLGNLKAKGNKSREIQDRVPKKGPSVQKAGMWGLGGAEHPGMC